MTGSGPGERESEVERERERETELSRQNVLTFMVRGPPCGWVWFGRGGGGVVCC